MIKITMLGTGSSSGVPAIGCDCAVCTSTDPKNKRRRASILVESETTRILIDTTPDMREQMIEHHIKTIDAVIYTHAHADHLHGIDDLRAFNTQKQGAIDVYADEVTLAEIKNRFGYVFMPSNPVDSVWYRPAITPHIITPPETFMIGDIEIQPFLQYHGKMKTLGLRFGTIAYSTDVHGFPEKSFPFLQGLDTWIVDCMRYEPSFTHAHLDMTLGWINDFKPKLAYLTHMNHDMEYHTLAGELPEHVFPAYDGLVLYDKPDKRG